MLLKQYRPLQKISFGKAVLSLCASLAILSQTAVSVMAQSVPDSSVVAPIATDISYEENGKLSEQLKIPVYTWKKNGLAPRGVVVAIHGLAMHGTSYDQLGRILADRGYVVVSTDLRGYGSYVNASHKFCNQSGRHSDVECKEKTNYEKSYEDIALLSRRLKDKYPSLPLFALGESLGGALVIRLAANQPDLVDGLILSAPALRHHSFIDPYFVADASLCMTNPRHQLDLTPFVRRYSSDDPRIVDEVLADPMARRRLSAYELLQVSKAVHKTVNYVSKITPETPVLVIQGSADKCVKAQGVMVLLSELRSNDQTVKWFHQRGHILVETAYIKPDTRDSVLDWLETHVDSPALQAKVNRPSIMDGISNAQDVGLTVSAIRVR